MSNQTVNYKTLADNLRKISLPVYKRYAKKAVRKAGRVVVLRAKANASAVRDTGALMRSLDQKEVMQRDGLGAVCYIGPDRRYTEPARKGRRTKNARITPSTYAHIAEFGSSRTAPKPFMRPALDSAEENARGIMANQMRQGLDEVARTLPETPPL